MISMEEAKRALIIKQNKPAECTVKPTFKILWQEYNACVEKKQAMAGCMAEDKQYIKVPNKKMRCKSTERSK